MLTNYQHTLYYKIMKKINIISAEGLIADKIKKIKNNPKYANDILSELNDGQIKLLSDVAKEIKNGNSDKFTIIKDSYIPKDKRRFIKLYVKEVNEIIKNLKSLDDVKILMLLFEKMNYDTGEIICPNIQISEDLNMDKAQVSKSLKRLINDNILLIKEGTEKRKVKTYLLNEKYFKYGR